MRRYSCLTLFLVIARALSFTWGTAPEIEKFLPFSSLPVASPILIRLQARYSRISVDVALSQRSAYLSSNGTRVSWMPPHPAWAQILFRFRWVPPSPSCSSFYFHLHPKGVCQRLLIVNICSTFFCRLRFVQITPEPGLVRIPARCFQPSLSSHHRPDSGFSRSPALSLFCPLHFSPQRLPTARFTQSATSPCPPQSRTSDSAIRTIDLDFFSLFSSCLLFFVLFALVGATPVALHLRSGSLCILFSPYTSIRRLRVLSSSSRSAIRSGLSLPSLHF